MSDYWPFGAAAGALALVGAAAVWEEPEGRAYPLAAAEARAILRQTQLPEGIYGSMPTASPPVQRGDGTIVWKLRVGHREVLRYTATVTPVDAGTSRVAVTLSPPPERKNAAEIARRLEARPQIRDFYLAAMDEQVAAALERRPVRFDALLPSMAAAMTASIGDIGAQFDEAAAEFRRRDRANIDRAYREETRGEFGPENDPDETERFD